MADLTWADLFIMLLTLATAMLLTIPWMIVKALIELSNEREEE